MKREFAVTFGQTRAADVQTVLLGHMEKIVRGFILVSVEMISGIL
jgi:hypothetical protein